MIGNLVVLDIREDGLHIILEPDGRELLEDYVEHRPAEDDVEVFWSWKKPYDYIWWELFEYYTCNGGPEPLNPESEDYARLGALTDAPIIAYDVERDDMNDLISVGRVFWFPNYVIESELETLLTQGEVVFQSAEDA